MQRTTSKLGSAARLPHFLDRWQQVTDCHFILNIVQYGYIIQFESVPFQSYFIAKDMSNDNIIVCQRKVKQFLGSGAIIKVKPSRDQFLSTIFPVPKKSLKDHQIILDLSDLNLFVRKLHFKLDSLDAIIAMIRPGDFFISIDISDAYYAIAMNIISMPYLTFLFLGVYYQFACLPQGLCSAPRIFMKVMRVVLSLLRTRGVRIAAWLDDFLLAASSASLAASHATLALGTLEELGFLPNYEKSELTPVQRISHLGLIWDSLEYTVSVPLDKLKDVQTKCRVALSSRVTVRRLSSILGSIEYFRWGFPYAAIHYRGLQRFVNTCLATGLSYGSKVSASDSAKDDLRWWADAGSSLTPRSLAPFSASLTVYSDASMSGWGGWTSYGREAFGSWSSSERSMHINVLELRAVLFLFRCFFANTYDCSIAIRTDSSTVVAYINHQGGPTSRGLCDLALEFWDFCIARRIMVKASHLGGVHNCRADFLSRCSVPEHSYFLCQDVFDDVADLLSFPLSIDCFASRLNYKLPTFISRYADPMATLVDAFAVAWRNNVYLFPPVPIIHRVLSKFVADEVGHGLLICPYWPSQPWFSSLLELLIDSPILLPTGSVVDEEGRLPRRSRLLACPIGSSQREQRVYRDRLRSVGCGVSSVLRLLHTKDIGGDSIVGFIGNQVVTVLSL